MKNKLIEEVRLQNFTVTLNPDEMEKFDRRVGRLNRSKELRRLVREENDRK